MAQTKVSLHAIESLFRERPHCKLYSYDKIPDHQKDNCHITHGYRAYLSAKQCIASTLMKSNESMNIWSHGVGFVLFLSLYFYDMFVTLPLHQAKTSDTQIFSIFYIAIQVCMACSSLYHTFNCHIKEGVARRWYVADIIGILFGIFGSYSIGLYYGFYCIPTTQKSYLAFILMMTVASGFLMSKPYYFTENWSKFRIKHLSCLVVTAAFPTVHWCISTPPEEVHMFLPKVLGFYLILAFALVVYLAKCPERYSPGYFNFVGSSHNWWHLLVIIAFLYWRSFAIVVFIFRSTNQCQAEI